MAEIRNNSTKTNPKAPYFSIVIPTRNRAHLLRLALQSAFEQTFDDYEIVISNNCSQDHTLKVIEELKTPKVRYVQPENGLSMPDHWEFALQHARGQYITYLCDDDALCPNLLEETAKVIEKTGSKVITTPYVPYFAENWREATRRNSVTLFPYTGEYVEYDSSATLVNVFSCRSHVWTPRLLNCFCHQDTVQQAKKLAGRLFYLCPDYSFAVFILATVPKWTLVDKPLRLYGIFSEAIGTSQIYDRGEAAQEFLREFKQQQIFERVPLKLPLTTNYIAETLLIIKEKLPEHLANYQIDWAEYYIGCWQDLWTHETNGVNVKSDWVEFHQLLAQQPAEVQTLVETTAAQKVKIPFRNTLRKMVSNSGLLTNLENQFRWRHLDPPPIMLKGDKEGFDNIASCAKKIQALVK